tara:strand:- start:2180 stop:2890 length:711 start_codon:yes stop_codon:yes gene_type:complete
MNNIRLFYPESLSINFESKLDKSQSHYLIKVMRVRIGNNFSLFNNSGEWTAKINQISKGIVEFTIVEKIKQKENTPNIWLAFSPIKSNYFNFMIQKSTELGVTKFIPIITDRTIVRKVNSERIKKIIIEACEQSNRIVVPNLEKTISLNKFINNNQEVNIILGDLNSKEKKLNLKKINVKKPICILIGPEGDFTELEREKIYKSKNIQYLRINKNILRSETAAISALSIVNYFLEL